MIYGPTEMAEMTEILSLISYLYSLLSTLYSLLSTLLSLLSTLYSLLFTLYSLLSYLYSLILNIQALGGRCGEAAAGEVVEHANSTRVTLSFIKPYTCD